MRLSKFNEYVRWCHKIYAHYIVRPPLRHYSKVPIDTKSDCASPMSHRRITEQSGPRDTPSRTV